MTIIDAQLHEPAVSLDWGGIDPATGRLLLTELQLAFMRAAGVDRAVLFPIDLEWGLEAAMRCPDRFGVVPMITPGGALGGVDAAAPDLEEIIAGWAAQPTVVGLRILRMLPSRDGDPGVAPLELFDATVAACESHGLPLFMSTAGDFVAPRTIAERHPSLTVIIDHLALPQPPTHAAESPPFKSLESLIALADTPNVVAKLSGVPTLSREPFPFTDLWPHLRRVVDAFGADRIMWGSDISRVYGRVGFHVRMTGAEEPYEGKHNYAEAVLFVREYDELSTRDRDLILGGTAQRLLRWQT